MPILSAKLATDYLFACAIILVALYGLFFDETSIALAGSVAFFTYILYLFYKHNAGLFFLTLPYNLPQFTAVISVAYLETGAFPLEIRTETFNNGATSRLIILNLAFCISAWCCFIYYKKIGDAFTRHVVVTTLPRELKYLRFGVVAVALLYLVCAAIWGAPLLIGEQRFFFWRDHPFGWGLAKLLSVLPYLGVFFGYYISSDHTANPRMKREVLILISIISGIAVLYGNKFSWFMDLGLFLGVGYTAGKGLAHATPTIVSLRIVLITLLTLMAMVVNIIYSYIYAHGYDPLDVAPLIISRVLELQGQVWWGIDNLLNSSSVESNFLSLITSKTDERPAGIFILMELIAPSSTFWAYFNDGVPFSMGYPAITYYALGFTGALLFQLVLGILWIDVSICLISTVRESAIIQSLVLIVFYVLLVWAFSLGSTYVLFSPLGLCLMLFYMGKTTLLHTKRSLVREASSRIAI